MQIKEKFRRVFDWFIPSNLRERGEDAQRQARLVIGFSLALSLFGMPFAIEGYMLNGALLGLATFAACALMGSLPLILKATGSIHLAGHTLMSILLVILFGLTWITDGIHSTPMISATGIPLVAVLMMGVRAGVIWFVMGSLLFATFYILEVNGVNFHQNVAHIPADTALFDLFTTLVSQGLIILILSIMYESTKNRAQGQLKAANEQLADANQQLEEARSEAVSASHAKSSFLANMSHEIRTPLNAILGYTELLKEEAEDMGIQEFGQDLDKIHTSGTLLLSLINDILDLSKIEAGKMQLHVDMVEIPEMVMELHTAISPLCAKNENNFDCQLPDDIKQMFTDRGKLRQSLLNLLSNACKFTEQGDVTLRIAAQERDGDRWIAFEVKDTGIGMSEEQLERLFQPFTQAESSTSHKYGGTGLGLVLSQRFCGLLGGEITVESEAGVGSTFTIHLPFKE